MCEQLAHSCYVERSGQDSNLRPLGWKSDAYTTMPPRHTVIVVIIIIIIFIIIITFVKHHK